MEASSVGTFALFLVVNLVASRVNHIDDTDETYGYWEPLHYLANNVGMQTWEYAPQYAIRTYGFIYPFYLFSLALKWLGISKEMIFFSVKALLGTACAHAQRRFVENLARNVGASAASNATVLLVLAPGVFFASTAYLPSAVCMTLLMLSISSWLENRFMYSIIWGSIAVLSTGWPFVGLLFVPLGVHMIAHSYASVIYSKGTHWSAFRRVLQLAASVVLIVVLTQAIVFLLDYFYYGKWTSPTLNILLYNAIGGSGDELYGVEPASYYIKNLFLNLGISWPLVLLSPAVYLVSYLVRKKGPATTNVDGRIRGFVLHVQALIWLAVLFSRPHKEERFLYPIYPLLAYVAGNTLDHILRIITSLSSRMVGAQSHKKGKGAADKGLPAWVGALKGAILLGCMVLSFALFVSRIASNSSNYGGYIKLWEQASRHIATTAPSSLTSPKVNVNVCTGSEWYQFPSHFFLPERAQLQYISDGFGGILPQHFASANGTAGVPPQPFNDRNQEVTERYASLAQCDYIVVLIDAHDSDPAVVSPLRARLLSGEPVEGGRRFRPVLSQRVISQRNSQHAGIFRAFYVPLWSSRVVQMQNYTLFEAVP